MDLGSLSHAPKLCLKFKCECVFVKYENQNCVPALQMENLPKPTACTLYLSSLEMPPSSYK